MFFSSITLVLNAQKNELKDTLVVGRVIKSDIPKYEFSMKRHGYEYYYGVHHFKIICINPETKIFTDTIIVAYVYNLATDRENYLKSFNLKINNSYIFHLVNFHPFTSDFIKANGVFKNNSEIFMPNSNTIIKEYANIYRIIFFNKYLK